MASDRISLDLQKVEQLLFSSIQHKIGVLCLTETHCRALSLEVKVNDIFKDQWAFHIGGDPRGGSSGTGFLVDCSKFIVRHFESLNPRISLLKTSLKESSLFSVSNVDTTNAYLSCYAPTESGGTDQELFDFYTRLDDVIGDCIKDGIHPIITGDFNVKLGEDLSEEEELCTGPLVTGMVPSPNCAYLFGICHKYGYVIANSFLGRGNADFTWYHPRTKVGHVKDLVLIPRGALDCFSDVEVDQGAVVGNNDHNLVIATPVTNLKHRRQICSLLQGLSGPSRTQAARQTPLSPNSKFKARVRRLDTAKLNDHAEVYRRKLEVELGKRGSGWEHTKTAMQTALKNSLPEKEFKKVPRTWQELSGAALSRRIHACNQARLKLSKDLTSKTLQDCLKSKKKELKKEVERSKTRFDKIHVGIFSDMNNGKRERAASAAILRGVPTSDPQPGVSPEGFAEHFGKLFSRVSQDEKFNLSRHTHLLPPKSVPKIHLGGAPTVSEVVEAIERLNRGKASGTDGLTAEMFIAAKDVLAARLTEDFSQFWPTGPEVNFDTQCEVFAGWQHAEVVTLFKGKGSKLDPGAYRGIFLLETAGKILSSVIAERLGGVIDENLSDAQCGFRKRRGTNHQIHVLRRMQSECRKASKPCAAVFIDFEKAFDSPPRGAIYECLEWIGCPPDLLAVIRAIHFDPHARVIGTDAWFRVARGIRQGCILGPMLFNLVLDFSVRLADFQHGDVEFICENKKDLQCPADIAGQRFLSDDPLYADDSALVGSDLSKLERSLQSLQDVTGRIGLNISVKKTEWMWLCPPAGGGECSKRAPSDLNPCCDKIKLNSKAVVHVRSFNYLGAVFNEDGDLKHEINNRISKAKSKLFSLSFLWKSNINLNSKVRLFKQQVLPSLLYGCETWTLSNRDWEVLEAFLNTCRLSVANVRRFADGVVLTNQDLHQLIELPSAATLVVPRQIAFSTGVVFKPSSNMARKMTFAKIYKPIKVLSGTEKVNFSNCLLANLGLLMDTLYTAEQSGPLGARTRLLFNAVSVSGCSPPLFPLPSTSLNLNIPFSVLGGWLKNSPRTLNSSRWVGTVARDICGMIGPLNKGEVLVEGQSVLSRWPNLQRQTCRDRHFQCTLCNAAYTERKALNRHNTKVHMSHESNLVGLGTQVSYKTNRRIPLTRREERGSLDPKHGKSLTHVREPSYSPEEQLTTDHNEGCKSEGGERVAAPFQCTLCNSSFKTSGWLTRHLKIKHSTVEVKAKVKSPIKVCIEQSIPPAIVPALEKADLPPQDEKSFSRHCLLCSSPGAGKPWTTFKSAQNHMARVHGINLRTGLPSRKRKTKATQ